MSEIVKKDLKEIRPSMPWPLRIVQILAALALALITFVWALMTPVITHIDQDNGLKCDDIKSKWPKARCEILAEYVGSHYSEYKDAYKSHYIPALESHLSLGTGITMKLFFGFDEGFAYLAVLLAISKRQKGQREFYVVAAMGQTVVLLIERHIPVFGLIAMLALLHRQSREYLLPCKKGGTSV